jgi:phospho-N-acetylmuramoyl-pentapeptide-transferase
MLKDTLIALLIGFFVTTVVCPFFIPILHRFKFGQMVRDDGPKDHLKKTGTPTMGGITFIIGILAGSAFLIPRYRDVVVVFLFTVSYGIIGLLDDMLKIKKKQSEGLKSSQKFILQLVVSVIFIIYLYKIYGFDYGILIPFTGSFDSGIILKLGIIWIPFALFVILGTDNGVNFTDGLDGLCSSVTIIVAIFFMLIGLKGGFSVTPITGAVIGSLMGFLIFNAYPAKVFMGDTGSLALGGFVASYALMCQIPVFIAIVGFIYMIEVISVIIQVGYFKATKGKRFFKMAPIHHHFELCGWSETKTVTVFSIITVILGILVYLFM